MFVLILQMCRRECNCSYHSSGVDPADPNVTVHIRGGAGKAEPLALGQKHSSGLIQDNLWGSIWN